MTRHPEQNDTDETTSTETNYGTECPHGCHKARLGSKTLVTREETIPLDTPRITEMYGEAILVTERTERYAECVVCGWRMDL